jgi:hypothetical protein
MFKGLLLPTDCKLCYWGRLALFSALGVGLGVGLGKWAAAPLLVVVAVMVGLKWLVIRYK